MLDATMTAMVLIAGSVSVLAIGGTFAAIAYYDAWTERKRQLGS